MFSRFFGLQLTSKLTRVVGACALLVSSATAIHADFAEPVKLTDSGGTASRTAMSQDPADNVFVASAVDGEVYVDVIGPNLRVTFELVGDSTARSDPDLAGNSRGATYVVFSEATGEGDEPTHDIFLASNSGGRFNEPENLTDSDGDEVTPRIALDRNGDPHIVWKSGLPGLAAFDRVFYMNVATRETIDVGSGTKPVLDFDRDGNSHFAYVRDDQIYYTKIEDGEFSGEILVASLTSEEGVSVELAADELGNVFVLYTSGGTLSYATKSVDSESFDPPRFIDSDVDSSPDLQTRTGGVITIVYSKLGQIYFVQGISDFLLNPEPVPGAGEANSDPSVVVDHCGNLHVSYLSGGEVWYTNNAADVTADFTASPPSGQGPLTVRFQDLSSGKVQRWLWEFGDGEQAIVPNPTHTYQLPGRYTVRLTVFNADREHTVVKEDFVSVQESRNRMGIPDQTVLPNQTDVWFPIRATHEDPLQGFQVHARFDPTVLTLKDCTLEHTIVKSMNPDVFECLIGERGVEIGVIFELTPPFDNQRLRPGEKQSLVNLVFDVSNGARPGTTEIRLVNNFDLSPIFNIFTINGFTTLPVLKSSRVTILDPFSPPFPKFFLRGDADGNGNIDITDAIVLLNFLFLGGVEPACLDAADTSDSGRVDISSPISILNFLFLGGGAPAVPFPNLGIDPTEDDLPPCE
ncbi:MAG: PKD domain-containing protein [Planctomycetota bacterium]